MKSQRGSRLVSFKEMAQMDEFDKLGLRCGLEIHQQLSTRKLFCSCPSEIIEDEPDLKIIRKLRAVAGELGSIDEAALHESELKKNFIYHAYKKSNCPVELDEEPPHEPNPEAIETALQIALLLNAKPLPKIIFMRKTVVDGSNTSGFQRTGLVAVNGYLEIGSKKVGISTICLEEEAAKIVERTPEYDIYNLSRLGIPLVEISTTPDLSNPKEVKECAEKIGMILRSTGKIRRGLGTIRQDVNVSIEGGSRVEIKGAQDLRMLDRIVEIEAIRQKKLLEIRNELNRRGIKEIKSSAVEMTNIFKETSSKVLLGAIHSGGVVVGAMLKGMSGLLGVEIQPGKRLGTELSEYAKKFGVSGIIHSDELPGYGISEDEVNNARKFLRCGESDAFFIIASDSEEKAKRAAESALKRAEMCIMGVPREVRRANADGTTTYMRPISGASRMYPETDVPIIKTPDINMIKIPKLITEFAEDYKKMGLSEQAADIISKSQHRELFESLLEEFPDIGPQFVFSVVFLYPKDIKSRMGIDASRLKYEDFRRALSALSKGLIPKEAVEEVLAEAASGINIEEAIKKRERLSEEQVKEIIEGVIVELKSKGAELREGLVMGRSMALLRGKADGSLIARIVKEKISEITK